MVLKITYNTFSYEVKYENFPNGGSGFDQSIRILKDNNENTRIENWFYIFLVKYQEELNDEDFKINFHSTKYEIDIVDDIVNKFNTTYGYNVYLIANEIEKTDLINDFRDILTEIDQKEKDDSVKDYFEKNELLSYLTTIEKRESQIVIAATMSAGKSTLINALIGRNLMPSKNEACTATICKIKDVDGKENFNAQVIYENGSETKEIDDLDANTLSDINEKANNESLTIEIEGDVRNISSKNTSAVLVDTPGPNNSDSNKHKEITFNYIKDSDLKPLIIYVLDATKLYTTDDKSVLEEISNFVRGKGVSSEDRFLFVLNRIDELDQEKESLGKIIKSSKEYLSRTIGISNPKIFPLSAEFARLCQLRDLECNLSRSEKNKLQKFENEFLPCEDDEYEGIDTTSFTPLNEQEKKLLLYKVKNKSREAQCFHRSGVLALQIYIQKYIENVHEIELGHELLKNLLPHLEILRDRATSLTNIEKKNIQEDIEKIENSLKLLSDKLNYIKIKLNKISAKNETIDLLKKRVEKDFSKIYLNFKDSNATKDDAIKAKKTANEVIENLEISLRTSIYKELDHDLKVKWDEIIDIIKKDFYGFIYDLNLSDKATTILSNDLSITLNQKSINDVRIRRKIKTGEKEVSTSIWWKPQTWFSKKKEVIYESREFYNLTKLYNDQGFPQQKIKIDKMLDEVADNYNENIKKYIHKGQEIATNVERNFSKNKMEKISKLDKRLSQISQRNGDVKNNLNNYLSKINDNK